MRRHRQPYTTVYRGQVISVFPGVLSPRYDWSGKFGVDCLPPLIGKTFLEIGCGCGIVSLFAALGGARIVVSVDISPIAVKNTKHNRDANGLTNAYVLQGDLFDAISYEFDVIFFNAPFHGNRANDWLERAVSDENYATLRKFFSGAVSHLAVGGQIIFGFSKSGDEELLHAEFKRANLEITAVKEATKLGYSCKYYTLERARASGAVSDRTTIN